MNPYSMTEKTDRVSTALAPAPGASAPAMLRYSRPEPPDARLVQQIEALSARVEVLEKRLRSLSECAVQQYWDGRLHLPAGKFTVIVGTTRMTMESNRFSVVVNGKEILGSAGSTTAPSTQPMPGGGAQSWQSMAAANGIQDPRRPPPPG